jgi:hypothetical protein
MNTSTEALEKQMTTEALVKQIMNKLNEISQGLKNVNERVDALFKVQEDLQSLIVSNSLIKSAKRGQYTDLPLDVVSLLSLPDHLRKSAIIVAKLGEASSMDVSRESQRARALESGYLNQLVNMGYLKKRRKGRDVYFSIGK